VRPPSGGECGAARSFVALGRAVGGVFFVSARSRHTGSKRDWSSDVCSSDLERARRMYERRHGRPPKNVYGESLFEVGCAEGLRWARGTGAGELLAAFPRYHPRWAWWLIDVPVVREVLVSNLVLVLRAR